MPRKILKDDIRIHPFLSISWSIVCCGIGNAKEDVDTERSCNRGSERRKELLLNPRGEIGGGIARNYVENPMKVREWKAKACSIAALSVAVWVPAEAALLLVDQSWPAPVDQGFDYRFIPSQDRAMTFTGNELMGPIAFEYFRPANNQIQLYTYSKYNLTLSEP